MTIKYLDSKRIVKLSTDVLNTPTLEDDFSSDDWTDVGSLGVSGGTLGGDGIIDGGDDTSYKDMTSISETAFLFRFKATYITTFGSGSASRFIHFGLSDKFAPQNTTQDFVGFSFEAWNAPAFRIGGQMRNGQTLDQPSNGNLRLSELDHSSAGTFTYWFEVIRNGNAFTLNVYSDSGYSTLVDSVTSTVTGITALRYFSCTNKDASGSSTGTLNVAIDDLKFYNGVSSITTNPTNVQDNSILVNKDTGRRYWFSEASATWTKQISSTLPTVSGLQLHLDASDASTITKDGSNLVSAWNDKSGQANHVTQATGSKQPLWVDQVQDTLPTIRFDGSSDEMAVTYGSSLSTAATVFIVCTMPTASGGERMVFDGLTSGGRFAYLKSSGNIHYMYRGNGVSSTTVDKTMRMFTLVWNGSSSSLGIDGTDVATGNVGTQSPTGLRLGAQYNSVNFGDTDICEILIYGSALSTTDRTSIEDYLSNKWSTP